MPPGSPAKRPPAWSLSNWPVRWKVLAIVLVPLILAAVFGGLRVNAAMASSSGLRLAAARADLLPAITKYMSALDVALLASSTGRDVEGAKKNYDARKGELQTRLADTDVTPDVRVRGEHPAERRPIVTGQGGRQQHWFAGPGDHLCAAAVDGRGRHQRVGARRR